MAAVAPGNQGMRVLLVDEGGNPLIVTDSVSTNVRRWGGTAVTTAVQLADNLALPTAPLVGAVLLGYDGTTLDLVDIVNGGILKTALHSAGGDAIERILANADGVSVGSQGTLGVTSALWLFNGTSFDRARSATASVGATGVFRTEQKYSYSAVAKVDTQVKATAGFLHSITIMPDDAAATAGSLIVYDSASETGTVVVNITFAAAWFAPVTLILDVEMTTGIYVGMTTTGDVNFTCAYR